MNAYLLTASVTRTPSGPANLGRPARTSCFNTIVCADNAEEAQKRFEEWLSTPPEGEIPIETQVHKMVVAPFVDQLLTETESVPMDWPQIAQQGQLDMESVPAEDFDLGYWLDANEVFGPSKSLEAWRAELPEDIRSGLNWAEDKQFFFLLSVLSPPPPPPPEAADEAEAEDTQAAETPDETASGAAFNPVDSEADFPELVGKEAAVLIRARNAAVAAWLWRKYAADKELAGNQIRIDPWCGVVGPEARRDPDAAIAYYTKAIELKPEDAMHYINRGSAKRDKSDLDGAIADFTTAIELNPKYAWAYHARGCLRHDAQAFTDALIDFRKAIELDSSFDKARLRVWLVRARLGEAEAATAELQTYLGGRNTGKPDDWESKIGHFLAGQLGEPEFLAAAKNADQEREAGQLCQAYFYAGSKHLFAGDKATAADYFPKSIATDKRACTEYSSAEAELKFLKA